ncbi:MAG: 4Fe-4S dicluster domain-containing protein [Desulfobacteraceae bacterium]|nr:4Fe-4S dicluster domain-containing protein [Desulfobacteraceae bacterium]
MKNCKDLPCYVTFDSENCTGCGACVRTCPTKAIRIKDGKSLLLVDNCIGGGLCINVCPQGCITPTTIPALEFRRTRFPIIFVAPVLYSQFRDATPGEVLKGLKSMGFKHTVDMSYFFTLFKRATEQHLKNLGPRPEGRPVISTMCPVVLRLIAFRFPSLLDHLHPMLRPVSVMVKDVAAFIADHHGIDLEEISIFYLNPCPTKMNPKGSSPAPATSHTTRAIGINQIYAELSKQIKSIQAAPPAPSLEPVFEFEEPPEGKSLLWGISGGETAESTIRNKLSISGMNETLEYLEKIELGLFKEYDFIEFRTCREGCVGGSLCAVDKYVAKNNMQQHVDRPKTRERHRENPLKDLYAEERFFDELTSSKMEKLFGQKKAPLSIENLTRINRILKQLPGFNCAACGAPDCLTFAEDVVRGRAGISDCSPLKTSEDNTKGEKS